MGSIILDSFVLEIFDYNNNEHFDMIRKFDNDKEIRKYIISTND